MNHYLHEIKKGSFDEIFTDISSILMLGSYGIYGSDKSVIYSIKKSNRSMYQYQYEIIEVDDKETTIICFDSYYEAFSYLMNMFNNQTIFVARKKGVSFNYDHVLPESEAWVLSFSSFFCILFGIGYILMFLSNIDHIFVVQNWMGYLFRLIALIYSWFFGYCCFKISKGKRNTYRNEEITELKSFPLISFNINQIFKILKNIDYEAIYFKKDSEFYRIKKESLYKKSGKAYYEEVFYVLSKYYNFRRFNAYELKEEKLEIFQEKVKAIFFR